MIRLIAKSLMLLVCLVGVQAAASAADCHGGGERVRIASRVLGAVNQEAYREMVSAFGDKPFTEVYQQNLSQVRVMIESQRYVELWAGQVLCARTNAGFFQYARNVDLPSMNLTVWVREKDVIPVN